MSELVDMMERQAAWQRARAQLPWTEKLRLAGELRKAAETMWRTQPVVTVQPGHKAEG
jgi:hypothetical protein